MSEVIVPDIGDAEDVEVIEICVAPGDIVAENDALIVIESDKASMEVPAPFAGTVAEVLVALGDQVNAGDAIVQVETAEAAGAEAVDAPTAVDTASDTSGAVPVVTASDGVAAAPVPAAEALAAVPDAPAAVPAPSQTTGAPSRTTGAPPPGTGAKIYAGPAVRRLARELGVPLEAVPGTGARGRIVKADVKAYVKRVLAKPAGVPAPPMDIDFSRFGEVEHVPLSRIRARGAVNLGQSWRHVVHVTQHDDVDVTELEVFRASLRDEAATREVKLTLLAFIVKACVHALKKHPQFNASLDAAATTLIHKRYYNIGLAVDTEAGLLVPVVRAADRLGIFALAEEIARLSTAARAGRLRPEEIQGGSFTISSLGAIGGTGFTPVVNAPELAILGVARLDTRPRWDGAEFRPRQILPLSLSYDHRAINGAEAGRFVADLAKLLADVRQLAL